MKKFGLNSQQVTDLKRRFGGNALTEILSEDLLQKFIDNFNSPMVKILCIALFVNIVLDYIGQTGWTESFGITLGVILVTFVSTYSEYKNNNSLQKLKKDEASKMKCKAYRDNNIIDVPIDDIVVSDCVILQTGDKIPADGVLIDGTINVDQSALNGESKEIRKISMPDDYILSDASADFLNEYKVFRGTTVYSGSAVMKVTAVGDKSFYGQNIKKLSKKDECESSFRVKLSKLVSDIGKFSYIGAILIAVAFLFQQIFIRNNFDAILIANYFSEWKFLNDIIDATMLATVVILMSVPKNLSAIVMTAYSFNMNKMLKDNIFVQKISGIETVGDLNILFTDKTGIITSGQLETAVFIDSEGNSYNNYCEVRGELEKLLSLSIYHNTNAVISDDSTDIKITGGNATERAILAFAANRPNLLDVNIVNSIPFESVNKYSATQIQVENEMQCTLCKGAPECILPKCFYYFDLDGNRQVLRENSIINKKIEELAKNSMRIIALAISDDEIIDNLLPMGAWTLVGIIGIKDTLLPEAVSAISEVTDAGVQIVMITGDHKDTALATAKECGLFKEESDIVISSDELKSMSDDQVKQKLNSIRVIARALPSDKSRLVRLAQELNLVVGVIGDSVHDLQILNGADIGFAMGSGMGATKESSDIVILDDNFSSIDKSILYGRTIFNNIRKSITFRLTINIAVALVCFVILLFSTEKTLSVTQILWIGLITNTLAPIAFCSEPTLKQYMKEKPKRRNESIITPYMWHSIFVYNVWIFIISMFILLSPVAHSVFREDIDNVYLMTGYFTFFISAAVFNAFNIRTEKMNLLDDLKKNKYFLRILCIIGIVQLFMIYRGGAFLNCYDLTAFELLFVLIMAISIIPVDLIRKKIFVRN